MSLAAPEAPARGRRWPTVSALGIVQIFAWGSSYYLMAPLAQPIVADTGWPLPQVIGAVSLALLVAGLCSPRVGHLIARHGGRPVLSAGMVLLAAGLLILATSQHLAQFYLGWAVIGLGMSAGLYEPAFATLGRLYGQDARAAITALTLWGGFASTVCWPLSALLVEHLGWRGTAASYAALHLFGSLPVLWRGIPREARIDPPAAGSRGGAMRLEGREHVAFWLLALIFTLAGIVAAMVSIHLVTLLAGREVSPAAAVALGALIGPAQVGARVVEMAAGGRHHPRWTLLVAATLFASGLALLATGLDLLGLALILYGGGNGLFSIARGALPLAIFGPRRYAPLMGRLARPSLIAQAAAPMAAAFMMTALGPEALICALTIVGAMILALSIMLQKIASAG